MAKVINPFFPEGIDCLKYKPNKNLKDDFTHTVLINKHEKKRKGGNN